MFNSFYVGLKIVFFMYYMCLASVVAIHTANHVTTGAAIDADVAQ